MKSTDVIVFLPFDFLLIIITIIIAAITVADAGFLIFVKY